MFFYKNSGKNCKNYLENLESIFLNGKNLQIKKQRILELIIRSSNPRSLLTRQYQNEGLFQSQ